MPRILRRAAAVAAAALIPAAVLVPAAHADIAYFSDPGAHITSLRVSHGPSTIGVTARDADMEFSTYYEFWLDTNPNDPGPEYRVDVNPNSEVLPLMKVANFDSPGIKQPSCTGLRVLADASDGDATPYAKVIVPRSCMGNPSRVRVSVVGYYEDPDITDWAPGTERFTAWVSR
jgi:hypothetical protein